MTTKTHVVKSGDEWSWEETPEVLEALRQYYRIRLANKAAGTT